MCRRHAVLGAERELPSASSGMPSPASLRSSPPSPLLFGTAIGLPTFSRSCGATPPSMQLTAVANVTLSSAVSPPGKQVSTCLVHSSDARNHVAAATARSSALDSLLCHALFCGARTAMALLMSTALAMCSTPAVSTCCARLCSHVALRNALASPSTAPKGLPIPRVLLRLRFGLLAHLLSILLG